MNPALCVVTTIGTSLLSNLAGQGDAADLREASNLAEEELSPGQRRTIDEITAKARDALGEADPGKDRFLRACAELEGLHALCGDRLTTNEGRYDLHYLIATDTALGHRIGELIASSLRRMGQNVELVVPVGLSTRSQASFIGRTATGRPLVRVDPRWPAGDGPPRRLPLERWVQEPARRAQPRRHVLCG